MHDKVLIAQRHEVSIGSGHILTFGRRAKMLTPVTEQSLSTTHLNSLLHLLVLYFTYEVSILLVQVFLLLLLRYSRFQNLRLRLHFATLTPRR
jgi:hypothetical protein